MYALEVRKSVLMRTRKEFPRSWQKVRLAIWNHSCAVCSIALNPVFKCGYCLDGKEDKQKN